MKTFDARTRERWRQWLAKHHGSEPEVWLIFHKKHTGTSCLAYTDALDEALCYGWIDSLVKRIDDNRYARKFTPRKPESNWSSINIKRYNALKAAGKLTAPGLARSPDGRPVVDAPPPGSLPAGFSEFVEQAEKAIQQDGRASRAFEALAPSHRRRYVHWVAMAKREETRQSRLREALAMLRSGKKLGLK
jgi:uncharacterized protein YdeI (YjbR/CyaY-like superfamily)